MIMAIFRAKYRRGRKEVCKDLNVNEEYLSALRTKSYADFFNKAQVLLEQQESNRYNCHQRFSEILLEPAQVDTISAILESAILSELPELKALMLNYFDISAEASNFCGHLLTNISQISHNYGFIQRAVDAFDGYHLPPDHLILRSIFSELHAFTALKNPFSNFEKREFKVINDKYSSTLHHLKSKRKRVARKIKMMDHINKASGICATTIIGLVAITAMFIAAHAFVAILMAPAIVTVPNIQFVKKKVFGFGHLIRRRFLRKIRERLDVAAKGTYILNRDFDMMSRLVGRLHDEIEHKREMIRTCLERREDAYCMDVVIKELKKSNDGFRKQVEELEEHVYLCLVTINRARALVVKEIKMESCTQDHGQENS